MRVYKSTLVTLASQSSDDPGISQPALPHWSIFMASLDTILCPWCVTKEGRETRRSEKEEKGKTQNCDKGRGALLQDRYAQHGAPSVAQYRVSTSS